MSQGPADWADLGALAGLAPELASTFVSLASDIALVIGPDGVVRNIAQARQPLSRDAAGWVGQRFADAVGPDTRAKVLQLLHDVDATGLAPRRELNLPGTGGQPVPVAFSAIRLGRDGPVLAVGRDLRAIAAIQQRFQEAQQEMERDFWKRRQAEARWRQLFHVATDAVLVVDADSLAIVEANAAAADLLGERRAALVGQPIAAGIDAGSRPAVDELLVTARHTGHPAEIHARLRPLQPGQAPLLVDVSATPFRATGAQGPRHHLLVRVRRSDAREPASQARLADIVEHTPDGVVITDSAGRLQTANPAFLLLCAAGTTEPMVRGRTLAELLGDPAQRLDALLARVLREGIVAQQRITTGRGLALPELELDVSAALLDDGDQACIGLTLRRHLPRADAVLGPVDDLAQAIGQLADQLGRVPLPELMQETLHLAERHLMRSALARVAGNLELAAQSLGIPSASLLQRLQRHGLASDGGAPPLLN